MLKSILRSVGVPQNLERIKAELEQEANVQIRSVKTATRNVATISAWAVLSVFVGVLAAIVGICLIFAWLAPTYGAVTALAILFILLLSLAIVGILMARSKYTEMPTRPRLSLPAIWEPVSAVPPSQDLPQDSMQRNYDGAASSSAVSDSLFDWLFSVARQATPTGNTGSPPIDQLFTTLKPRAEVMASEAMTMALRKLRTGDRKTMLAILGTGVLVGWLAARQRTRH